MSLPELSLLESRILAVLVEKERTVPDTYPLSLNTLQAGCNQKTSRDPVITASEAEILTALDALRGPQTAAELRANTERLHRFADVSSVEAFLAELTERSAGALVVELPRAPGARENRWAHLLCGQPEVASPAVAASAASSPLAERVTKLEAQVAELTALVNRLRADLGDGD